MKRWFICLILMIYWCGSGDALDLSARSAILLDGDTGRVIYEKNPDQRSLIASTTKIMTALVVLEQAELSDVVEIPPEAVGVEGSSIYLQQGEQLTVEDLLYGLMLSSGNDAAVALALYVSDSISDFAEKMNEKAQELHMDSSHFANPNGLDSERNYATARDLAVLAGEAMKNKQFCTIVSAKSYHCTGHDLVNHNKLLWQYAGAVGVKTGYTRQAGRILVGAAERNGRRLISVTIHAPDDWKDHQKLLDFGFSQYEEQILVKEGQSLGELPVMAGEMDAVPVVAGEALVGWTAEEDSPELRLYLPEFLYAPVRAGTVVGTGEILLGEKSMGKFPLVAAEGVEQLPEKQGLLDRIFRGMAGACSGQFLKDKRGDMFCRNVCKRF